ncbi:MAG TPA: pentapeptide repeat-containing protein [Acidimicrobiales bacterium]|nr:pentapeptide repeat-containing protein [Acidimicrobiales bacterium]
MNIFVKVRAVGVAAVLGATVGFGSVTVVMVAPAEAAITCNASPQPGVDYYHCNLAGADFSGADLAGADFQGATVTGANLQDATLTGTILTGANFAGSDFTGADLANSFGQRADFSNANFTDADLDGDTFTRANFSGATFSGATFSGTIIQAADLAGAQLSGAVLAGVNGQVTGTPASIPVGWVFFNGYLVGAGANLRGANLIGGNMPGINLSGANVSEAKFTGDDLTGALFTGTSLFDTGFENANLTDADFSGDNLDGSNLTGADLAGTNFVDANLENATLFEATGVSTTDVTGVTWLDTTCPDGTNSNFDGGTCLGHGFSLLSPPLLLSMSTTSSGYGAAGQTIPYSYLVTNPGTLTMTGVAVSDALVPTVTCPFSTLAGGAAETCTGMYTVTQTDVDAGSVTNTATASGTNPQDVVVTSAPSPVTVLASLATSSISLTKSTTSTGYNAAGQTIPYSYLVANTGTTTLVDVGVSDDLVPTVSCTSGTLAPGAAETCGGTYTVTLADMVAGSVTNVATASGTNPQDVVVTSAPSSVTVVAADCDPPVVTSEPSVTAVVGSPFHFTVTTCSTAVPRIRGFELPQGLRLVDNHNGTATISGTPWVKDLSQNWATIRVIVKGQPKGNQVLHFTMDQAPTFRSSAKYTATAGVAFSFPVLTVYGNPLPTITTSTLPGGVNFTDNGDGTATLTGEPGPTAGGAYPITITATNGVGPPVNQAFVLTVYQAPAITSVASDTVTGGVAMTPFAVTDAGYPAPTIRASGLPSGVSIDAGIIEGTPKATAGRTYPVKITATSKAGTATQDFELIVSP